MIVHVGLNKAGSVSLTHALRQLGFNAAHKTYQKRRISDLVAENIQNDRPPLHDITTDAILDFNGHLFWKQILEADPDAKFIFLYRDENPWLDSTKKHITRYQNDPTYMGSWLVYDADLFIRKRQHVMKAKDLIPTDKLLTLNICDGDEWEPLCQFLDVPVPNATFPKLNVGDGACSQHVPPDGAGHVKTPSP